MRVFSVNTRRHAVIAAALISAAPLLMSAPAKAQETGAQASGFEDIIVTARRREERLQDVPIAVSAISGDALQQRSALQVTDLSRTIPGISVSGGGFGGGVPRFNIRSQVQFEQLITLDPSVGIYFADVVQARAHGTNSAFFDLASVEVLKGPQGTLFGRNTTGGAIVITPKGATDTLGGYISGTYGNYDTKIVEGAVNVPIMETLSLRVAGRIADRNGYSYSPAARVSFDDERSQSWRATLLWQPSTSFTNNLVVNGYHANERGTGFRLTEVLPGSSFAARPDVVAFLAAAGDRRIVGNEDPNARTRTKTFGLSNTSTLDLGGITIKNIFGYRKVRNFNQIDFDGTPFFIYSAPESLDAKQWSNELQALGKAFDDKLDWIIGGYWFKETGEETQRSTIVLTPQDITRTGFVKNVSKSLFAQGTYSITDSLSATAGLRYTWDKRQLQQIGINLLNNTCSAATIATPPACLSPLVQKDFGALTYTVSLDYKFGPNQLVYVAHRKGYRSGGFNLRANNVAQFQPFAPEYVKDIEVGLKADWDIGGTQLRTNLAAYYQWYSDIQRAVTFVDPVTRVLTVSVINAATAHVTGFEGEIRWLPVPELEISAFGAHSKLRYDDFRQAIAGGGSQDLSGNRIGFSPEWSGGGSIRYTHALQGNSGSLAFQGDVYTQSKVYLADINVPFGIAAGYTLANFRIEWNDILGSRISAATYLRNAFDKKYFNGGISIAGLGPIAKQYGLPRTYGLELRIPFGD